MSKYTRRPAAALALALGLSAASPAAFALSGETLDSVAGVMAWVVMLLVPGALIYLFWMVHILPEKIAEKVNHPQKDAIHMICLLSLVFGGLLWPIAFIWAKTKPVLHKMAYGTDKHPDAHKDAKDAPPPPSLQPPVPGEIRQEDLAQLRAQLDSLEQRAPLPPELVAIRTKLRDLEWRWAVSGTVAPQSENKGPERGNA